MRAVLTSSHQLQHQASLSFSSPAYLDELDRRSWCGRHCRGWWRRGSLLLLGRLSNRLNSSSRLFSSPRRYHRARDEMSESWLVCSVTLTREQAYVRTHSTFFLFFSHPHLAGSTWVAYSHALIPLFCGGTLAVSSSIVSSQRTVSPCCLPMLVWGLVWRRPTRCSEKQPAAA